MDKNRLLVNQFISHTKKEAQNTALPFYISYSSNQIGQTFGERITNSVDQVLGLGFEHIIVIGNDCPNLDAKLLNQASSNIEERQIVLGPNKDGGIYLMGLHKNQFDKKAFCALDWETPQLYQSFKYYIEKQGIEQYDLLILKDANQFQDLKTLLFELPKLHIFRQFLVALLAFIKNNPFVYTYFVFAQKKSNLSLKRGPPFLGFNN